MKSTRVLLTTTSFQDTPGRHHDLMAAAGFEVVSERGPLPDFLIGAHALLQCSGLITRDAGFFRDYFKGLKVIVPKA